MNSPQTERWLLPEGTEEVLPDLAWQMELRRRRVLDLFRGWGYELVRPPLAEFRDALLTGIGAELANDTVTVTDPLSGRLMGIRADMTPQVARIESHYLRDDGISRLCYAGPTLFARPFVRASREPLQCGVEFFGSASPLADCEIIELMVNTVTALGIDDVHIDIGHMGLFSALVAPLGVTESQHANLIAAMQRKSRSDVADVAAKSNLSADQIEMLMALLNFSGDVGVIQQAKEYFKSASKQVTQALSNLAAVADHAQQRMPDVPINIDLSELRGYRYHTGVIFSLFTPGYGGPVARGGRYDNIGVGFGRSRPATGFSTDLRLLFQLASRVGERLNHAICAPFEADSTLTQKVRQLRDDGETVIYLMPEQTVLDVKSQCNRTLVKSGSQWNVVPIN